VNKLNNNSTSIYKDAKDSKNGYCWIISFKNFVEDGIYIQEANVKINTQPRDMVSLYKTAQSMFIYKTAILFDTIFTSKCLL
jgi:hypothetical protein